MNIPENLKYTKEHEWILVDGNIATIGITDYAQSELGDVVYLDIDSDLTEIVKGETFGTIEAVKTVSDIFGPFNGTVIELNNVLTETPELINIDPYGKAWMIKAEINNTSDLEDLLDSKAYKELIGQ
jgi:glycine cleavage system H protein